MIPLRVIQVGTDLSVAYCGLQFALWGSDVAVLRVPGEAADDELTERYLSANKRLIAGTDEAEGADLLITAQSPAALADLGIESGDAIVSRIVPYAENGILDGTPTVSLLLEAASGYLGINGSPDREPLRGTRQPGGLHRWRKHVWRDPRRGTQTARDRGNRTGGHEWTGCARFDHAVPA